MSDVLEDICAEKRVHIDGCKAEVPLEILERIIKSQKPPRGFAATLSTGKIAVRTARMRVGE